MKTYQLLALVPPALVISLFLHHVAVAEAPVVTINRPLQSDPMTLTGTSGGSVKTDCGHISKTPSHIIEVTKPIPYLQLTVESEGKPTLLVDGPGGRFCVLSDDYIKNKPKLSGYWSVGKYSVSVGDLSKKKYNYTLSISEQKK